MNNENYTKQLADCESKRRKHANQNIVSGFEALALFAAAKITMQYGVFDDVGLQLAADCINPMGAMLVGIAALNDGFNWVNYHLERRSIKLNFKPSSLNK